MNAISCPSGRQGIWELEGLELDDWDWDAPDMCLAGGNRQDNELLKLGRKTVRTLKKALGFKREK
ncbi:hypothetical protein D3Z51_08210 [Clostridiaceae bacterium]|nr:hypothetical protein [Clostridiaceae bacterium]RKI14745.1 hypothetical protein D7V81_07925 [bacterium 1XD21-70]